MTDDPRDPPEQREITAPCPDCAGGGMIQSAVWIWQTRQTCGRCHGMGFIVKPVGDKA